MIQLHKGQYLSDIMQEIPTDCILSKRIPGCGATTLELTAQRSSIIVVPNVPVIIGKCRKYPNLLGVYEGSQNITDYLKNNHIRKIMTTPESFIRVKSACEQCEIDIYSDFFLLIDECHQLVEDIDYRTDIVMPMNDFFLFKHKALVSATPIAFSDPRFNHFQTIELNADYDYRQAITVTHTYNIAKAFSDYLQEHKQTVCIFMNSITECYSLIKQFNLQEDATIYCASKSRAKLKAEYGFDNAYIDWSGDTMKKYNFFTGRFFTAFDLDLDYQPDLLMITDPYISEYTQLSINTDCIQICGRFRNGINSATHIYRVNPQIIVQSKEQIEKHISEQEFVYNTIQTLYNSADYKEYRIAFGEVLETAPFRKFLYPDFTKNWFAIDNEIYERLTQGRYQSVQSIQTAYNDCHFFQPTFTECRYNENDEKLKIIQAARSTKDKRRKIVQLLDEIAESDSEYCWDFKNDARQIDPFIVEAFEILGKARIEELQYSKKRIKEAMILKQRKGNKVIRLIKNTFKVGNRYTNAKITEELSRIFGMLGIHPEKTIKGSMIKDYFQVKEWRTANTRGYTLISELI